MGSPYATQISDDRWRVEYRLYGSPEEGEWSDDIELRLAGDGDGCIVYLVQGEDGGPVKIGRSTLSSIENRLASLQTGNPQKLVVRRMFAGGQHLETLLHAAFSPYRLTGEWFALSDAMDVLLGVRHIKSSFDKGYALGFKEGKEEGEHQGYFEGRDAVQARVLEALGVDISPSTCPTLAQEAA